jgi:hypothetical protein
MRIAISSYVSLSLVVLGCASASHTTQTARSLDQCDVTVRNSTNRLLQVSAHLGRSSSRLNLGQIQPDTEVSFAAPCDVGYVSLNGWTVGGAPSQQALARAELKPSVSSNVVLRELVRR